MTFHIPEACDGRVLRSFLKLTVGISKATLSKLKNHPQGILVNGERVTVRHVLHTGDVVELADADTPETATHTVLPTELPLDILYEDDRVIALNKPPHMPTHPSHGHLTDTLANALAWRYHEQGVPFVFRPLGRLDRNTSGVVITGKSKAASGALGRSLLAGQVSKRYVAILSGDLLSRLMNEGHGFPKDTPWTHTVTVKTHMYRPDGTGIRRQICGEDIPHAEVAITRFAVLGVSDDKSMTLVMAEPVTGRTHQLRLHFAHLGAPILGDDIYGETSALVNRHALHALAISLPLPFFKEEDVSPSQTPWGEGNRIDAHGRLHTYAPIPEDMTALLTSHFPRMTPLLISKILHSKEVLNEKS